MANVGGSSSSSSAADHLGSPQQAGFSGDPGVDKTELERDAVTDYDEGAVANAAVRLFLHFLSFVGQIFTTWSISCDL